MMASLNAVGARLREASRRGAGRFADELFQVEKPYAYGHAVDLSVMGFAACKLSCIFNGNLHTGQLETVHEKVNKTHISSRGKRVFGSRDGGPNHRRQNFRSFAVDGLAAGTLANPPPQGGKGLLATRENSAISRPSEGSDT